MSKRLMSVTVRGRAKAWSFNFYADPRYMSEWQADGLDVWEVLNVVPKWWVDLWPAWFPALRVWCFVQDVLNFKNPWADGPPPSVCHRCRFRSADGKCTRWGLDEAWFSACHNFERGGSR